MNSALLTANDNEPFNHIDSIGLYAVATQRDITALKPLAVKKSIDWTAFMALSLWGLAIAGMICVFFIEMESRFQALAMGFALWSSVWAAICAKARKWNTIRDTAIMTAIAAIMAGLTIVAIRAGWPLHISHIVLSGTLFGTVIAMALQSRIALGLAQLLAVVWVLNLPQLIGGPAASLVWAVPAIWAFQMLVAQDFKSRFHVSVQITLGLAWLSAVLWQAISAGSLSLAMGVTCGFVVGALLYRMGKVAKDQSSSLAEVYTATGWTVAAVSALALQDYLLGTEFLPFLDYGITSPLAGQAWDLAMALGVFAIGITGLIRFRSGHMSALGVSASLLIAAAIPLLIWGEPVWTTLAEIRGYTFGPLAGLALGGVVLAASAAIIFTALRQDTSWPILIGVITAVATLALNAQALITDNTHVIIFAASAVISAVVIAAFTRRSNRPYRAKRSVQSHLFRRPVAANA